MGLILWNDLPQRGAPFDGLRLAHKLECDPGTRAARDYESSLELSGVLAEPRSFAGFALRVLRLAEKYAPLPPDVRERTGKIVAAILALGAAALEPDADGWAAWQADVDLADRYWPIHQPDDGA